MTPREKRFLSELLKHPHVSVDDLRKRIGALNPAQIAMSLRKKGWDIHTGHISVQDRDGLICHPGYYSLSDQDKNRARKLFLKGADDAAPSVEHLDSQMFQGDDSMEGKI